MKLTVRNASCGYNGAAVIENVNFEVNPGEIVCILGANGIGKTTIFRSVMGFLKLIRGEMLLDNEPIEKMTHREFAKKVAYVPQGHDPPFSYTVLDVVVMGRVAHLRLFEMPGEEDYRIARHTLELLGIRHLGDKPFLQLSGGERQMVMIARALTQNPLLLIMDEPTANLDFGNQIHVLACIQKLAHLGLGVLMTTHNPDHAFLCGDKVILLTKEKEAIEGSTQEVVTEENLRRAYGIEVRIVSSKDDDGKIVRSCIPVLDDHQ